MASGKALTAGIWLASAAALGQAQTAIDLRTQTRNVDFTGAASTRPVKSGTTLPATCEVGAMFFKTDALAGSNLYGCPATNIWKVLSPEWTGGDLSGAPGGMVVSGIQGRIVTADPPEDHAILRWSVTTNQWEVAPDSDHLHSVADVQGFTAKHGTGTQVQMFTGTAPNAADCAQFDANGNIVSAGAPCGTGSGGGGGGVPYTGATLDVNLGTHALTAASVKTGSSGEASRIQMTQGTCPSAADSGYDLVICVESGALFTVTAAGAKTSINLPVHTHASTAQGGQLDNTAIKTANKTGTGAKIATAAAAGTSGNCVSWSSSGDLSDAGAPCGTGSGSGSGNVNGPNSSTDTAIAVFSGTTGKIIQNSPVTLNPSSGDITTPGAINTGSTAAGSILAKRGSGTAKIAAEGATSGEWSITPPASFTSWSFTPPTAPCASNQWWTTNSSGVGSCTQPAVASLSDGSTVMRTTTGVTASQMPALTGDVTSSAGSVATTVGKVNAVTFPASPATNTVPVVTASNTATYMSLPDCGDSGGNHLNYNATTHAFSCGTTGGSVASVGFGGIDTGTNSSATMTCGTGCTITRSGSGVINANQINGASAAASATTDTTVASNISSGTLGNARLTAAVRTDNIGASFTGGGSVLTSGSSPGVSVVYRVVPFDCTVVAWDITVDTGTAGFRVWRKATGTSVPTAGDAVTTADLAISTGTALHSTSATNWTGGAFPSFTANDIIAIQLNAASGATFGSLGLTCQK